MTKRGNAKLIGALVEGMTIEMAAEKSGLSEATVYRRLQDAGFRREVSRQRRQYVEVIVSRMVRSATLASVELEKIIRDEEASTSDRLKAIRTALDFGGRWMDRGDLGDRVLMIEEEIEQIRSAR